MTHPAAPELKAARQRVIDDVSLQGRELCHALASATDAWLADRFAVVAGGATPGLALAAVGGHGREELAPGSDLDLLLIHDGRHNVAELAEGLWYPVWDAGLKLGHAVRTPRQALALVDDDLDTATALLSLRLVAGDAELTDDLAERALGRWRARGGRWLSELARRQALRASDEDEVAFLLEPDLKTGRGGLRDIHALFWAQAARPVLHEGDDVSLRAAEDLLLDVRVALHRCTARPSDVLLLERQDEVAAALGHPSADALMAAVATAGRAVAWTADDSWGRARSAVSGPLGRVFRRDRPLGTGLVLRDGEVHVEAGVDAATDRSLVLRAAAAAAAAGARIDRSSLDRLAAGSPALTGPWPGDGRATLVDLLATGRPAIPVLEALDQRGLVERVLPEWAPNRSKPQRNALHRFTVDRHLCETAANAAALTSAVGRPDLLLVGAWLHDLGKGYPGDHTDVGVGLMASIAPRMGFDEDDSDTLVALVRHHLLLPDVATRRDLADDGVIEGVAERVGSLTVLELLAALAEADGMATGPSAWGPWKAELVGQLVERVARVLRGVDDAPASAAFPGVEVRRLLANRSTVISGEGQCLVVVAPDRPGLFSRVAGTLSLRGLTVLAADAVSEDGMAAAQFRVAERDDGVAWPPVAEDVGRALEGRLALEARLAERAHRGSRRSNPVLTLAAAPHVRLDNAASASATIVEVRAPDGVGVLYRITRALADLDLDIRLAKVSTLGAEVLDSFYVRTTTGAKVTERDHQREVERAILHALSS